LAEEEKEKARLAEEARVAEEEKARLAEELERKRKEEERLEAEKSSEEVRVPTPEKESSPVQEKDPSPLRESSPANSEIEIIGSVQETCEPLSQPREEKFKKELSSSVEAISPGPEDNNSPDVNGKTENGFTAESDVEMIGSVEDIKEEVMQS